MTAHVAATGVFGRRDQANRATVPPAQLAMLPRLDAKTRPARSKMMAVVRPKAISAENRLTSDAPYRACSGFTRVTARTVRCPPYGAFSRGASDHSSPPDPPRVLPAGARVCRPGFPPGRAVHLDKAHTPTTRTRKLSSPLSGVS